MKIKIDTRSSETHYIVYGFALPLRISKVNSLEQVKTAIIQMAQNEKIEIEIE